MNRVILLIGAVVLQVAGWFDVHKALNISMSPFQTACAVGSLVLMLVWLATHRSRSEGE